MRKFLTEEKMAIGSIPLMGTCAGCVIMSDFMPTKVIRNGYGRQRKALRPCWR